MYHNNDPSGKYVACSIANCGETCCHVPAWVAVWWGPGRQVHMYSTLHDTVLLRSMLWRTDKRKCAVTSQHKLAEH
jgi:hypothetical protein